MPKQLVLGTQASNYLFDWYQTNKFYIDTKNILFIHNKNWNTVGLQTKLEKLKCYDSSDWAWWRSGLFLSTDPQMFLHESAIVLKPGHILTFWRI